MHFAALLLASFLFSDIPWNTPGQTVVKKLAEAGFKVAKKPDRAGDYAFSGMLLGHPASGIATIGDGKLVRVIVTIVPTEETVRDTYLQVRDAIQKKYGKPAKSVQRFLEPFHDGDGYEDEAIRAGKAVFATGWSEEDEALVVNITQNLQVAVTYESPGWAAEAAKRAKGGF
ncbi:MAG TPA: hypothetical protein VLU46_11385 [Thermoanaerobaculia bacterium]|nr:hypothetical protein [Thermoanaerobaculia bacterium]